jgi:hypothetical protein
MPCMISISITAGAYDAIKVTLPEDSDSFPPQPDGRGNVRQDIRLGFAALAQQKAPRPKVRESAGRLARSRLGGSRIERAKRSNTTGAGLFLPNGKGRQAHPCHSHSFVA